ncbi:hypothetical protein GCM10020358_29140 [Amorphoplanes nipponensis]|uniref:Uncharacterized protein n=2 Tax=Actinoplanes nipponensis TaxID=135950 RepID=A0A919MTL3_9ACTN|nr:hypothetical protein Ani05nite_27690 [Actinoplanes nipponensis]
MLHRIAGQRPGSPVAERPPAGQALRLAGSALAVATILGVGGVARWALADGPGPGVPPAGAASATPWPKPSAKPTTGLTTGSATEANPPRATAPVRPPGGRTRSAAPLPGTGAPRTGRPQPEPVWADGSINPNTDDTEGRSEITVKVREPLSALEVTVRVAPTAGLTDRGATHDVPAATIDAGVVREREALVYRFTLAGGAPLAAGTYVFTVRYGYDNEGGRDAGDDTYRVTATTAAAAAGVELRGDFA